MISYFYNLKDCHVAKDMWLLLYVLVEPFDLKNDWHYELNTYTQN